MNSRLIIKLGIDPNCGLIGVDQTDYTQLPDFNLHVMLSYLVYNGDLVCDDIKTIDPTNIAYNKYDTYFKLNKDGVYGYYKLLVPTLEHYKVVSNGITSYNVDNKYFYYNGSFYYSPSAIDSPDDITGSMEVTDYFQIWDVHLTQEDLFWYDEKVFSICKLENCLVSLQKKVIENCYVNKCSTNVDIKYKRDFVFDSIYVLNYLINAHNYEEASRILSNLQSCGDLCQSDTFNHSNPDCGCGNSI